MFENVIGYENVKKNSLWYATWSLILTATGRKAWSR